MIDTILLVWNIFLNLLSSIDVVRSRSFLLLKVWKRSSSIRSIVCKCSRICSQRNTEVLGAADTSNCKCSIKCRICNTSSVLCTGNISDFNFRTNCKIVRNLGNDFAVLLDQVASAMYLGFLS